MLNYLRQTDDDGCLFLHVHARHILGVPHDHGEYFEGLLHRCGLIPERIVIQVDPPSMGDADERLRTQAALRNYRRRGHRLAMNVTSGFHREKYSRTRLGTPTGLRATRPHLPSDREQSDRVGAGYDLDRTSPRIRSQGHCPWPRDHGAGSCGHRLRGGCGRGKSGRPRPDLRGAIRVPVHGSRPSGSRIAPGTGPVREGDVLLRYA